MEWDAAVFPIFKLIKSISVSIRTIFIKCDDKLKGNIVQNENESKDFVIVAPSQNCDRRQNAQLRVFFAPAMRSLYEKIRFIIKTNPVRIHDDKRLPNSKLRYDAFEHMLLGLSNSNDEEEISSLQETSEYMFKTNLHPEKCE